MSQVPKQKQKKDRIPSDFYETPAWCVDHLMASEYGKQLPGGTWLEPSAGHGAIIRAVSRHQDDINWRACEIRKEAFPYLDKLYTELRLPRGGIWCPTDFLRDYHHAGIDVIIGNPPYLNVEAHVRKCLDLAPWVVLLLRSTFDGSAGRIPLHTKYKCHKDILPFRPEFDGDGGDMADSAWFIWSPDREVMRVSTWSIRPFDTGQINLFGETK